MKEVVLKGKVLSSGNALGIIFCYSTSSLLNREASVPLNHVSKEIARYRRALRSSREELRGLQKKLQQEGSQEAYKIIDVQMRLLSDPFIEGVVSTIKKTKINAYAALCKLYHGFAKKIAVHRENPVAQETLIDVRDLSERILFHLHPNKKQKIAFPKGAILVVEEMTPSLIAGFDNVQLKAIITTKGSLTSHGAVIAQSKKIPLIAGIDLKECAPFHGVEAYIDGFCGEVVINPSKDRIEKGANQNVSSIKEYKKTKEIQHVVVNTVEDIEVLKKFPNLNVGLVRTECLFENPFEIDIKSQTACYQNILDSVTGTVNFRLFDFTEDKACTHEEKLRLIKHCSLRFLLQEKNIVSKQLQALCSLNDLSRVKICIPFVTFLEEVMKIKEIISSLGFNKVPSLGCMIETPSCALLSKIIAQHVSFFCIGTNDLSHLTLGTYRNEELPKQDSHIIPESLEYLFKIIYSSAKQYSLETMVCGEYVSSDDKVDLLRTWGYEHFVYSLYVAGFSKPCTTA